MERKTVREILELKEQAVGARFRVGGHVRSAQQRFARLYDGSTGDTLQLVFEKQQMPGHLPNSTTVEAVLVIKKSEGGQQTVEGHVESLKEIGKVRDKDFLPAIKKEVSFDVWRQHLDVRAHSRTQSAIFRIRSALSHAGTEFMRQKQVLHLDPNTITAADCEGAGEMFIVTTFEDGPQKDWSKDFFGNAHPARLTVSSQLQLEALCAAMGPVYTTNPSFRAEKSKTRRHLSSFTHWEAELPFLSFGELMDFVEAYVRHCFQVVLADCKGDLAILELKHAKGVVKKLQSFLEKPFARLSYDTALLALQKEEQAVLKFEKESQDKNSKEFHLPKWGEDLGTVCERYLSEVFCKQPLFVHDMPAALKSFYMRKNQDDKTVQGCDLLIPGLGELVGGSMREHDLRKLVGVMAARSMLRLKDKERKNAKSPKDSKPSKDAGSSKMSKDAESSKERKNAKEDKNAESSKEDKTAKEKESAEMLLKAAKSEQDFELLYERLDFGPLNWYVALRKNAATPTGGFGLGFDRLVTVCTSGPGGGNIRDAVPFPVCFGDCRF